MRAGCPELPVNELQIMSREDEISLNTRSMYIVIVASEDDICSVRVFGGSLIMTGACSSLLEMLSREVAHTDSL